MKPRKSAMVALVITLAVWVPLLAATPTSMTIQGKLTDDAGKPYASGSWKFWFRIMSDQYGGSELWSEDQGVETDELGLWTTTLGKSKPIPETVFADSVRWLEVIVDVGPGPVTLPRVRLSTAPYSFHVATLDEATGGDVHGDLRLHSNLTVGQPGEDGNLYVTDVAGTTTAKIEGEYGYISSTGNIQLLDAFGGTVLADLQSTTSGGRLETHDEAGSLTGSFGSAISGGYLSLYRAAGAGFGAYLDGDDGNSGQLYLYRSGGLINAQFDGADTDGGARIRLEDGATTTVNIDAIDGSGGARIQIYNANGVYTGDWDGDGGDAGAVLSLRDGTRNTVVIDGNGGGGGGGLTMYNSAGLSTIQLDADESDAGEILLYNEVGYSTVRIQSAEAAGNGAQIALYDFDSNATIILDAQPGTGPGRVTTQVLEITGGADLSEHFVVRPVGGIAPAPGAVVCIDPAHPGDLVVSDAPYCRTVAGIVSGAGGVIPGVLMRQEGSAADGILPVALTGRVYVLADADRGPIAVGDLLTTSATAGHAMRVDDHIRAAGAIIGKAMTPLASGRGLVLVLVSLQ